MRGTQEELYDSIGEIVEQVVAYDRCFLIVFRDDPLETMEIVSKHFGVDCRQRDTDKVYISREILRKVIQTGEPVTVTERDGPYNIRESFISSGARSVLCLPIISERDVFGVLYVDRQSNGQPFQEDIVENLAPIVALVSLKIENLRLVESQIELQLNRREQEIAQSIQERLIQGRDVLLPGFAFEAYSQPCLYVGGDCLDSVWNDEKRRLTFVIGDVTGKGLPAALHMVGVQSTMRAHIVDQCPLNVIMKNVDSYVQSSFAADHFLSLFLGELHADDGIVTFCNAGHVLPLIFTADGRVRELQEREAALNIAPYPHRDPSTCRLNPGDLMLLYTDGISEKFDHQGDVFGTERLIQTVRDHLHMELPRIRQAILSRLRTFGGSSILDDDITLIMLRRKGLGAEQVSPEDQNEILARHLSSKRENCDALIEEILQEVSRQGITVDQHFHRLCLDEAFTNAIVHGNQEDPSKLITVRVFSSVDYWGVEISDQGIGFDWNAWIKRLDSGLTEERASGRGIALLLNCCNKVEFANDGRTIRLIWNIDGKRRSETSDNSQI